MQGERSTAIERIPAEALLTQLECLSTSVLSSFERFSEGLRPPISRTQTNPVIHIFSWL